jgi:hypothetical protein
MNQVIARWRATRDQPMQERRFAFRRRTLKKGARVTVVGHRLQYIPDF